MKTEKLQDCIGNIGEDLIENAGNAKAPRRNNRAVLLRCGSIAACVALIAAVSVFVAAKIGGKPETPVMPSDTTSVTESDTTATTENEIHPIKKWDEKELAERYTALRVDGKEYVCACVSLPGDQIGDFLGKATAVGFDIYTDTEYSFETEAHSLKGISSACAFAARLAEDSPYFVYTSYDYTPTTFGQFITDLDLRNTLVLTALSSGDDKIIYKDFTQDEYREILLSFEDAKAVSLTFEEEWNVDFAESLDCSVFIDKLGVRNLCMKVTKNGYIWTNILGTAKIFEIGEDAAQTFFDYADAHFTASAREFVPGPEEPEMIEE